MIVERDGLTYVPISTFAKEAGIESVSLAIKWVEMGLIHYSYCIEIKLENEFKGRFFVRLDKAKDFRNFLAHYKRRAEFKNEINKLFGVNIKDGEMLDMYTLGFIKPEWYKVFGIKQTMVFFCVDYIKNFIDALYEFRRTKGQRNVAGRFDLNFNEPPPDAVVYKPNENCEGFLLTQEQIERLKTIREYKEGKEPLF